MMDIIMGNPTDPAYIPFEYINFGQKMTFLQRVVNTLIRYKAKNKTERYQKITVLLCRMMYTPMFDYFYFGTLDEALMKSLNLQESPNLVSISMFLK